VSHESDLALLEPDDPSLFSGNNFVCQTFLILEDTKCIRSLIRFFPSSLLFFYSIDIIPLEMGELPDLRDQVYVCGFPVGGDEISISEGVVSRIEVQDYHHGERRLLSITVDAAVNAGNRHISYLRNNNNKFIFTFIIIIDLFFTFSDHIHIKIKPVAVRASRTARSSGWRFREWTTSTTWAKSYPRSSSNTFWRESGAVRFHIPFLFSFFAFLSLTRVK
jgi:hypothetical protein